MFSSKVHKIAQTSFYTNKSLMSTEFQHCFLTSIKLPTLRSFNPSMIDILTKAFSSFLNQGSFQIINIVLISQLPSYPFFKDHFKRYYAPPIEWGITSKYNIHKIPLRKILRSLLLKESMFKVIIIHVVNILLKKSKIIINFYQ